MKKQKLCFVIPALGSGGAEKSLLSLLATLDFSRYEVDLFLLTQEPGLFFPLLRPEVNLLPIPETLKQWQRPLLHALAHFLRRGRIDLLWARLCFSLVIFLEKKSVHAEQRAWRYYRAAIPPLTGQYDAVIGYLEKTSIYLAVDRVDAPVKIGWIHTEYNKMGMDPRLDRPYFAQLDALVSISEQCCDTLRQTFPEQARKVRLVRNIFSTRLITTMAAEAASFPDADFAGQRILSIGRLTQLKGFDLAIGALAQLRAAGIAVRWYVIGVGPEEQRLRAQIAARGLGDDFLLLGEYANPYPLLARADIYAQPSRYEGRSIAVDEARVLHKPILVADFSTAAEQTTHGVDGLIVPGTVAGIAEGLRTLLTDRALAASFTQHLAAMRHGTEEEIEKVYALLETHPAPKFQT